jgi:hypothetical protein
MITVSHLDIEVIETKNETAEQKRERRNTDLRNGLVMCTAPAIVDALGLEVIGQKYQAEVFGLLAFGSGLATVALYKNKIYNDLYIYGAGGVTVFFAWLAGSEWLDRRERLQEKRALKRTAQQRAARRKVA